MPARGTSTRRTRTKPSRNEDATFVEIKLPADFSASWPETRPVGGIELYLPGRRCLVMRPGFDRQTLLDLLSALDATALRFAAEETQRRSTGLFTTREEGV